MQVTLVYNLGDFLRTLATPEPINNRSFTSLKARLIKIGAKRVSHGRYTAFQTAEVALARAIFAEILSLIAEPRPRSLLRDDRVDAACLEPPPRPLMPSFGCDGRSDEPIA